ncbi:MAG: phosphate ABC transporter permease subunit PstC, partial [Clostridiales bacterium]|nr:phosphate ABC transporter permease subunit PstC [Clostridiales bacterium]
MSLHRNADQPVSIIGSHKTKSAIEITANIIFIVCAFVAIVAVLAITIYMIYSGAPALFKVGILDILFGTTWAPTAEDPSFGILYIILTSIIGTTLAILIGVPIALMTAIFLSEVANSKLANIVRPAVELLAGIPSVIYGLLGVLMINPAIYKLEQAIFKDAPNHQFTGGANLLSAVLVLAIMILPTVINISETSLRAVPQQYRSSSLALGASKIQTIFKVTVPAARSGIITG